MTCEHCVASVTEEVARDRRRHRRRRRPRHRRGSTVTSDRPVADADVRAAVDEAGLPRWHEQAGLAPRPLDREVELDIARDDLRLVREPRSSASSTSSTACSATVNYATEKARVTDPGRRRPPTTCVAAVEAAGYHAPLPVPAPPDGDRTRTPTRPARCAAGSWSRAVLTAPGGRAGDGPGAAVHDWQWLSLRAGHPGRRCGGRWPFHRAAWTNLRHGAATMDTLVSLGVARRVRLVAVRAVPRRRRACPA